MGSDGNTYLYTLAVMMVTFAGFSAMLLGIRQAAGTRLSLLDRYLAKTVLMHLFALTAGSLLPPLLAFYGLPQPTVWRLSAVLFGLPMLALLLTYPHRRRRVVGKGPPTSVILVFVVLGSVAVAAMVVDVLGALVAPLAVYATAITINFFTTMFAFIVALDVILQQPSGSGAN